jgi:hypothetical protein
LFQTLGRLQVEIAARQQIADRPGCNFQFARSRTGELFSDGFGTIPRRSVEQEPNPSRNGQPEQMANHRDKREDQKDGE